MGAVPQPQPVYPLVGNLPQLQFDMLHIPSQVSKLYEEYETDTLRLTLFGSSGTVRTRSYPDVLHLLKTWPKLIQKRKTFGLGIFSEFLGEGLASQDSDNPSYKKLLEIMGASFRKATTDDMLSDFTKVGARMVDLIEASGAKNGGIVDMQSIAMAATVDSIGLLHFRTDLRQLAKLGGETNHPTYFGQVSDIMSNITKEGQILMLPSFINSSLPMMLPGYTRYKDAIASLDDVIQKVMQHRASLGYKEADKDVLGAILQAYDKEGNEWLTPQLVRDQMTTLFFAGSDTTASTVAWTLYELSRNLDVQRALQREIDELLASVGNDYSKITAKVLDANEGRSSLLQGCIKETLRMYPPAPIIGRDWQGPEPTRVDGYEIPPDTTVIIDIYSVHRNPKLWAEPDRWAPERWSSDAGRLAPKDPKALIPFAPGPRSCIGRYFAERETQMFLILMLNEYDWSFQGEEPDVAHAITVTSLNGINLTVQPRAS